MPWKSQNRLPDWKPCKGGCGRDTRNEDQFCVTCWELKHRIEQNPELAAKFLGVEELRETLKAMYGAVDEISGYWTEHLSNCMQRAKAALALGDEPEQTSGDVCTQCHGPIDHQEPHTVCDSCREKNG